MGMSPSIVANLSANQDLSVSALEEPKTWLVSYAFTKPENNNKYCGAVHVRAKTIVEAIIEAGAFCEQQMSKVAYSDPDNAIEVHEWDGYQIMSISLCMPGSL